MVRSRWIKAVMATVVSTGLAWGQSGVPSPSQAPDDPTGRIITVNEAGKPPQKCRVVKVTVDDKGRKILQVESLANGEVMTIITEGAPVMGEPAAAGHPRVLKTQIFHWGRDHTPPAAVADGGCSSCGPVIVSAPPGTAAPCPSCGPTVASCDTCKPAPTTVVTGPWVAPSTTTTPVITSGPAITSSGQPATVLPAPTTTVVTTTPPKPKEPRVTQAEPSLLDKLRESWGKGDKPKAPAADTTTTTEPKKPTTDVAKVADVKKPVVDTPPPKPQPLPDLPHTDTKKADPLLSDPTLYSKKPMDQKLPPKSEVPPTDLSKQSAPTGEPLGAGSKSVTDSGAVANAGYPVAMFPPMNMGGPPPRPPQAPVWNVPQAPQPITKPGGNPSIESNQGGYGYNAFTPVEFTPPRPGSAEQGMLGNAFSTDYDPRPVSGVFGPSGPPPGMVPPGMMPPGAHGPMNAMLPSTPYGPVVRLQGAPGTPNPMAQGTQLAMLPPRNNGVAQVGYQAPAAPATGMAPPQLTTMLRDALYPSQREWAAEKLSALDWKQNDAAVQALTQGVHDDPAPTVRAACIRCLAKMKADSYAVVSAVQAAKKDADLRVRNEADEALGVLTPGAGAPAPLSPAVQPTATVPPPAPTPPAKPAPASSSALPGLPN